MLRIIPNHPAIVLHLLCAVIVAGCASLPDDIERPVSHTVVAEEGHLAELLTPYRKAHPGKSGFLLLDRGDQAFAARVAMADLAEETLSAQYFLWQDDLSGNVLAQAVVNAADRGVKVRLLLDDLGAKGRDWQLTVLDAHPNVEMRIFNPFAQRATWDRLRRTGEFVVRASKLNHRMHNKIFTVDGQAAIVGGRNIGDYYFGVSDHYNFRDLDVLTVGPVAVEVGDAFDAYWNSPWAYPVSALSGNKKVDKQDDQDAREQLQKAVAERSRIQAILPDESRSIDEQLQAFAEQLIWADAEVIYDMPDKVSGEDLEDQPISAVTERLYELGAGLQEELLVETAYFIPRKDGVNALASLVSRGVTVKVLTNSLASNNHASAHSGYRRYRKSMVAAGINLFELSRNAAATPEHTFADHPDAFLGLHSKAAVFDRRSVFIGTLNLDPRSIVLNTEMGLLVHSETLAEQVAKAFERDMAIDNSWRISVNDKNKIRWTMETDGRSVTSKNEPEASLYRKMLSWIAAILPIEGQL